VPLSFPSDQPTLDLPHWESPPADLPAAIREVKAALRDRIEASGRTVAEVFAAAEARVAKAVAEIRAEQERGDTVWPVIEYADIANGTVSPGQLDKLRRQVEEVTARAQAVIAGAHTDAELRAARHTLVDLQLELADLSDRIDRAALQSRR